LKITVLSGNALGRTLGRHSSVGGTIPSNGGPQYSLSDIVLPTKKRLKGKKTRGVIWPRMIGIREEGREYVWKGRSMPEKDLDASQEGDGAGQRSPLGFTTEKQKEKRVVALRAKRAHEH